eukprot:3537384-Amphidinium_carterae.1
MQHTVLLPQLGGKMQDGFDADTLYVVPLLNPPTIRGGPRTFIGWKEEKTYRNAVNNAAKIPTTRQRQELWDGGQIPAHDH